MRLLIPLLAIYELGFAPAAGPPTHAAGKHYAFLARIAAHDRKRYGVPGLAMIVVRAGKTVFARGYGYADRAEHTPVSVNQTIFHLASTSAVFTTVAVLQLAVAGKLSLHSSVRRYLGQFPLPVTHPVTAAELLINTAGFQDRHIDRRTLDPSALQPLGPYLAAHMPPQVQPPGLAYSYSAYSYALAGYLAQVVSHRSFAAGVAKTIFRPLAMAHSSFFQRLPVRLRRHLATGYEGSSRRLTAAPREYYNVAPDEGMVASAGDVAHVLSALTNRGRFRGQQVLPAALIGRLERERYSAYPHPLGFPPMPGVTYGFGRYYQNGQILIEHSGAVRGFSSLLAILPHDHLGYFIAGNIADSAYLFDIQRRFLNHLFPPHPVPSHPTYQPGSAARFAGTYWIDGYPRTTIEKLRQLVDQIQVTADGRSHLLVQQPGSATMHLTQVAPDLFQHVTKGSATFWAFQTHDGTRLAAGGDTVYDRVPWYAGRSVQLPFVGVLILLFLSGIIVWLILPLFTAQQPGIAGLTAGITSALILVFMISLALALLSAASTESQHYSWLEYQPPWWVYAILTLPFLSTALTVAMVPLTVEAWIECSSIVHAAYLTLLTLAALAFIPFLLYWNLLGYRF